MKKILLAVLFTTFLGALWGQDIPSQAVPPRLVNDFAKQLSGTEAQLLEQKLVAYNDSTSTQITIVIVPSTGDYPIADYAFRLGREWGVGQAGKSNGVVILWASGDRKIFIATGEGMEGALPDAIAKRIISQILVPNFQNGMFYKGLDQASDAIIRYAAGEYTADKHTAEEGTPFGFVVFLVIFIIILVVIANGNGGGGKRGGHRSATGPGPVFWPYTTYGGSGRSSGSWGGGGFGGGFGGFGGGSFGGGGAGGSY